MNADEIRFAVSVSVLVLMATGWLAKLHAEGTEIMDVSGLVAAVFVLGWLTGRG